jgi:hypothetical protein
VTSNCNPSASKRKDRKKPGGKYEDPHHRGTENTERN